jgi:hypothetical protein
MPFRHVALFHLKPGTTPELVTELQEKLEELPALIPEIADYNIGPDAGVNDGNWDFVVVADFEDVDGYRTYRDHPEHRARITTIVDQVVGERAAVQYET